MWLSALLHVRQCRHWYFWILANLLGKKCCIPYRVRKSYIRKAKLCLNPLSFTRTSLMYTFPTEGCECLILVRDIRQGAHVAMVALDLTCSLWPLPAQPPGQAASPAQHRGVQKQEQQGNAHPQLGQAGSQRLSGAIILQRSCTRHWFRHGSETRMVRQTWNKSVNVLVPQEQPASIAEILKTNSRFQ